MSSSVRSYGRVGCSSRVLWVAPNRSHSVPQNFCVGRITTSGWFRKSLTINELHRAALPYSAEACLVSPPCFIPALAGLTEEMSLLWVPPRACRGYATCPPRSSGKFLFLVHPRAFGGASAARPRPSLVVGSSLADAGRAGSPAPAHARSLRRRKSRAKYEVDHDVHNHDR